MGRVAVFADTPLYIMGGVVMIGSDYCRKKCPHFKKRFKILFWDFVVCDPEQKSRVEEPYIL